MSKPPVHRPRRAAPASPRTSNILRTNILAGRTRNGRINPVATLRHVTTLATLGTCPVKQECGACVYVNTDYDSSLAEKYIRGLEILKRDNLIEGAKVLPPLGSPRQLGYRTLFKLAVRPAVATPAVPRNFRGPAPASDPSSSGADAAPAVVSRFALGMFKPGTHKLGPDLGRCPIHAQPLARLIRDLKVALDVSPLTPFAEETKPASSAAAVASGDVRYVVARTSHLTGELMLTFVVTRPARMELQRIVSRLKVQEHKIHAAFMNINAGEGNAIFGDETIHLFGAKGLRERLCDLDFEVGPTAFFQVNPWQASNLYRRVEQIVGTGSRNSVAWDLYCGIGQISLLLARAGFRTLGVEENPAAIEDARLNARRNDLTARTEFIAARVEESESQFPAWAASPNVIVVNPSRRGLHENARTHLTHVLRVNPQARFVYVSCEVETMARDLTILKQAGFHVRQVEAFDMFAQTDNLEWLAVLTARPH